MSDQPAIWEQRLWPQTPKVNGDPRPTPPPNPEHTNAYAATALAAECAAVAGTEPGGRNDRLNIAAFNLGQLVAAGALDEDTVTAQLHDTGLACGLTWAETASTTASGLRGGKKHPRQIPAPPTTPTPAVVTELTTEPLAGEPETDEPTHPIEQLFPRIDWPALWAAQDDEEDWVLEPLLPARSLVALYSPPKLGKSLLMLELAVAISRGTQVLAAPLDRPRRVLYVDLENDPRGDIRTRLQQMGYGPQDLDGLVYLSFPTLAGLDTPQGAADLIATVDHYQCEVVIIDTISRLVAGEENDNDTWLNLYRHTGAKLKARGVTAVRLDHTGKDQAKGMRGGSAKYSDVDLVWSLTGVTANMIQLELTAQRQPVAETVLVLERVADPWLHHRVKPEGKLAAFDAAVTETVTFLDQLVGTDVPLGVNEAAKLLRENGRGRRKPFISTVIHARNLAWNVTSQVPWPVPDEGV